MRVFEHLKATKLIGKSKLNSNLNAKNDQSDVSFLPSLFSIQIEPAEKYRKKESKSFLIPK